MNDGSTQRPANTGRSRRWRPRISTLDWLAIALLGAGVVAVTTGLLPWHDAKVTVARILPLLVFLGAVIVLAELAARAEVFDVVATRLTMLARGRNGALFVLCLAFAAITTMFLNLDTTAVLLTPVMIATAARAGVPPMPLAMTTVWLANTASLLLPVSNLTNLLAMNRVGLSSLQFAERMWQPQAAALVATAICLWVFYWRGNPPRYAPPTAYVPADRRVFVAASIACIAFMLGILAGISIYAMAVACAFGLVVVFLVFERAALSLSLLPWRLLVFVTGLFLVVDTVDQHGLSRVMTSLIGLDAGASGVWRAGATGGILSNLLNNLPVYVAGEAVVPASHQTQLLGLLIGANVGPLVTPWASLAVLLWAERCAAGGVRVTWGRFMWTGAVTAALVLAASVGALLI